MVKIETIEISGINSALTALRLPFGKEMRSKVEFKHHLIDKNSTTYLPHYLSITDTFINREDLKLLSALVKRGDEHAKVVRGILAYAKITAPIYWWVELETYRAGHERLCSESTMHIDCKGLTGEDLQSKKAEIPMGKELTKVDYFSYQCLRNIVRQRRNHRLPEWHTFIDWVRTLPLAEELIFNGLEANEE